MLTGLITEPILFTFKQDVQFQNPSQGPYLPCGTAPCFLVETVEHGIQLKHYPVIGGAAVLSRAIKIALLVAEQASHGKTFVCATP
jgi:hypothetical protein